MKKILIVDDQPEVRELIEVTLRIGSYEILQAENGPMALEIARRGKPDLILLDVMMPKGGMDGYEVCKTLKNDPATKDIAIIMLTSKGQLDDQITGHKAGADGYFVKPFSPVDLLAKVDKILSGE